MPVVIIAKKIFLCEKHYKEQWKRIQMTGGSFHLEPFCKDCIAGNPVKEPNMLDRMQQQSLADNADNSILKHIKE
jgi:hypothetical protein